MTLLWYKTWLETRSRFAVSAIGISLLCGFVVFSDCRNSTWANSADNIRTCNAALFGGHMALCVLWVCAVAFLMMGGLMRESDAEVSSFTLALPISRAHLTLIRIGMGLMQAAILVVVPWGTMLLSAKLAGRSPSLSLLGYYVPLLFCGGMFFFAIALLVSSTIHGAYTAPLLSLLVFAGAFAAFSTGPLRSWNPWLLITGLSMLNPHTAAPAGPLPWLHLAIIELVSAIMVWFSIVAMQRQDF